MGGLDVLEEGLLKGSDPGWVKFVQMSPNTSIHHCHLFLNGHGSYENAQLRNQWDWISPNNLTKWFVFQLMHNKQFL